MKFELLLALASFLTTILIFFVQSKGSANVSELIVVFIPTIVFIAIFVIKRITMAILGNYGSMSTALRYLITGKILSNESTLHMRILNENGDMIYSRTNVARVCSKNDIVQESCGEKIYLGENIDGIPPKPIIIKTNVNNLQLHPLIIPKPDFSINGKNHKVHAWKYEFRPALRKGDYVEYKYYLHINGAAKDAFRSDGDSIFLVTEALTNIRLNMICPENFRIEIISSEIKERLNDGNSLHEKEFPKLVLDYQGLIWKPLYRENSNYIFRYRIVSSNKATT